MADIVSIAHRSFVAVGVYILKGFWPPYVGGRPVPASSRFGSVRFRPYVPSSIVWGRLEGPCCILAFTELWLIHPFVLSLSLFCPFVCLFVHLFPLMSLRARPYVDINDRLSHPAAHPKSPRIALGSRLWARAAVHDPARSSPICCPLLCPSVRPFRSPPTFLLVPSNPRSL